MEKLRPMCLDCLSRQLRLDYLRFDGRAVVVAPVQGPPVYVWQPALAWNLPDMQIGGDVLSLLQSLARQCTDCPNGAKILWIESNGLSERNFSEVLKQGLSPTLLRENPAPIALCGQCCAARICDALQTKNLSFIEVCCPKGNADGFVMPMGY